MTKLSKIDSQSLSTLVCNYFVCGSCGVIDRDWGRSRTGHPCSTCGAQSEAGMLAFPVSIHVLVDLVQQTFHSDSPARPSQHAPKGRDVGTVLYYCTLREALLNSFLITHLRAREVPPPLVRRLLDDNKLASQKFGNLFASAVEAKWIDAVATVSSATGVDYRPVDKLMRSVANLRNEFMHEGRARRMTHDVATVCVDSLDELVGLFAALHNEYTHPILRGG